MSDSARLQLLHLKDEKNIISAQRVTDGGNLSVILNLSTSSTESCRRPRSSDGIVVVVPSIVGGKSNADVVVYRYDVARLELQRSRRSDERRRTDRRRIKITLLACCVLVIVIHWLSPWRTTSDTWWMHDRSGLLTGCGTRPPTNESATASHQSTIGRQQRRWRPEVAESNAYGYESDNVVVRSFSLNHQALLDRHRSTVIGSPLLHSMLLTDTVSVVCQLIGQRRRGLFVEYNRHIRHSIDNTPSSPASLATTTTGRFHRTRESLSAADEPTAGMHGRTNVVWLEHKLLWNGLFIVDGDCFGSSITSINRTRDRRTTFVGGFCSKKPEAMQSTAMAGGASETSRKDVDAGGVVGRAANKTTRRQITLSAASRRSTFGSTLSAANLTGNIDFMSVLVHNGHDDVTSALNGAFEWTRLVPVTVVSIPCLLADQSSRGVGSNVDWRLRCPLIFGIADVVELMRRRGFYLHAITSLDAIFVRRRQLRRQ